MVIVEAGVVIAEAGMVDGVVIAEAGMVDGVVIAEAGVVDGVVITEAGVVDGVALDALVAGVELISSFKFELTIYFVNIRTQ